MSDPTVIEDITDAIVIVLQSMAQISDPDAVEL